MYGQGPYVCAFSVFYAWILIYKDLYCVFLLKDHCIFCGINKKDYLCKPIIIWRHEKCLKLSV